MNNKIKILLLAGFIVFIYIFTYSYISRETPLYNCDMVEQNLFWHDYSVLLRENPAEFFKNLAHDIFNNNRNPFSILLLLPFSFFMKDFRFGFIFSVEIMYMIPVLILIWHIFNKFNASNQEEDCDTKSNKVDIGKTLMILSSVFFFPSIWYSILSGIPDIGGMIPILICFILYFKYGFNKEISTKTLILTAVLLYLSFLARRWYAVVAFTFCASIIVENIITSFKNNDRIKQLGYTLFNLSIIGVTFVLLAKVIQGGYFRNILQAEFAERSLYIVNINQFPQMYGYLGLFICIVSLLGLILGFKNRLIRFTAINLFIYIFMFIVVMKNQLLWINHFAYIGICVCILFCAGLCKIIRFIKDQSDVNMFIAFVILFNICNFCTFFLIERPHKFSHILAKTTVYPVYSPDYDKILDLYQYLENEYNKNSDIKVAIYGLNNNIGYWQFRSINPDSSFAKNAIGFEKIIDDDFVNAAYDEDFAILFNPIGVFASDNSSGKVKEVSEMFENDTEIAKEYTKIKEFQLQDGTETKVMLYKRKNS